MAASFCFATPEIKISKQESYRYFSKKGYICTVLTTDELSTKCFSMKKMIITAVIALAAVFAANAQPRAIGGRLSYGIEASYQHTLGGADFIEANLGLFGFDALNATATYNFMIAQPAWTERGEWGFYAGPGASIGYWWAGANAFTVAAVGQVGLEYSFWFPLQLSVDLRPQVGIATNGNGVRFYTDGLFGFVPTLGVRYRF